MKDEFDSLTKTIGELRAQVEELKIRNEVLEYHLNRDGVRLRNALRELDERRAVAGFSAPPPFVQGWGKGKDE